jgi:hypothetical protein
MQESAVMRRIIAIGLLALLSLFPVQADAQGGYCSGFDMSSMEYADIAGDWIGHQRKLTILPPGCGVVYWRNLWAGPDDPWTDVGSGIRITGRLEDGTIVGDFGIYAHPFPVPDRFVMYGVRPGMVVVEGLGNFCREWLYAVELAPCGV